MRKIAAAPLMPHLNEGKGRDRKWRFEDNKGRVTFIPCKGVSRHGQNEIRSLDQPWRVAPMWQRNRNAAHMAGSAQGSVDFRICTILHGHEDMGPGKIGFHIQVVLACHCLPIRKAGELLKDKLFGCHLFR